MPDQALAVAEEAAESPKTCTPTMARVSEASEGWSAAREMSQAEVPIRAMEAPMAPAPSAEARARRPAATRRCRECARPRRDDPAPVRRRCRRSCHSKRRRQGDHAVGQGRQRGAVRHDERRSSHGEPSHRLEHLGLGLGVEAWRWARRGRAAARRGTKARASARRWRSPAESPAPPSPSTVSAPRGGGARRQPGPPPRARPPPRHRRRRAGPGGRCRRPSGRRGAAAGAPSRCRPRQASMSRSAQVDPAEQ